MATRKIPSSEQSTVKVRIIDFEMSGNDQSLQESLQTLAAAFSNGNQRIQVSRTTSPRSQISNAKEPEDLKHDSDDEGERVQEDDVQDVQPRTSITAARKPPKSPSVKVLEGINFTDTQPTLKEFYESKNPSTDLSKYLVVAYWYKNTREISDLTVDHFHTAFRALKVATPKNALQPIRDLRNSRNGKMQGGSTKGTAAIHHLGETFVEEMGSGG